MAVHVGSSSEWRQILQSTIVVADCKCAAMPAGSSAPKLTFALSSPRRLVWSL